VETPGRDCGVTTAVIALDHDRRRGYWAQQVNEAWRSAVDSIFETGRRLIAAKSELAHGEFETMVEDELAFDATTAQRLMAIARDRRLANPAHGQLLPPSWRTLYEITKLSDANFQRLISNGTIRPDVERQEIVSVVKAERRNERERQLGEDTAATGQQLGRQLYNVIYADPPWRFEPYSRETGMDRAADNHYPTMSTLDIMALAIPAARDCVLFLWATAPMLPDALQVIDAWGFVYKTHCVWVKENHVGTGYWFRSMHEPLLVATRGEVPPPPAGHRLPSVFHEPVSRHSEKPAAFAELIEGWFPNLPKLEMFARAVRPGWDCWGNEVTN
jgi:N6-adenosine-specific RNA methylase IME4